MSPCSDATFRDFFLKIDVRNSALRKTHFKTVLAHNIKDKVKGLRTHFDLSFAFKYVISICKRKHEMSKILFACILIATVGSSISYVVEKE